MLSFIITVLIYLLPIIIAANRNHNNFIPIMLVNLFLGFTFIGWWVALIWSFTDNIKRH